MSQYVTYEYYLNEFRGNILKLNEINKYLQEASEKIDSITHNRIVAIGFDSLTDFQKEKIQKAVCYQAEYIYNNGYNDEEKQDTSSYSVLDISVNVENKGNNEKTQAEKECMSEIAYDLIRKTGLDCRNYRF